MSGYPPDWDSRRKKVYRRDNYRCQNCGAKGGRIGNAELHAHHITPKSEGGSHSLHNLETLCKDCHNDVHFNMNTATSSSRGSTSSPYSFPDPDEVEIGLLGAIKAHIIAVPGLFFIMLVIDMFIVIISPYLIPVREVFTLSFILAGTLTMSRARSDDESMRIGTWILGSLYIGLGIWLII